MSVGNFKKFIGGAKSALPVVAGYLPLGFACGVIAAGVGMTTIQSVVMSLFVFAGSGQYIAVGMIGAGLSPVSVILTVFLVNLRHLLYTSALYPYIINWSGFKKAVFASEITDETFAVNSSIMSKSGEGDFSVALGLNITSHVGWVAGNFLGTAFGSVFENADNFGFDFALPALFIALLVPQLTDKPHVGAAVTAGAISIIFAAAGFGSLIILAAIAGAGVGVFMTRRKYAA